jgi:hypothetical protein
MAILPLPQRGQPIDYDYLYQITEAINKLSGQLSVTNSGNIIDTAAGVSRKQVPVGQTVIVAKKHNLNQPTSSAATVDKEFEILFDTIFDHPPVVTITPKRNATSELSQVDVLVITSITTSGVKGIINTTSAGALNVELQMIAVGVKSS